LNNLIFCYGSTFKITSVRKEEARCAAAIIGAEYICLDYDDEMFYKDMSVRTNFINNYLITPKFRGRQCGVEYAEAFRMANHTYTAYPFRVLP
jgi:LmbE family N-acetylglucosaminyl deacetylase